MTEGLLLLLLWLLNGLRLRVITHLLILVEDVTNGSSFDKACGNLQLSAVKHLDWNSWLVIGIGRNLCHLPNNIHSVSDLPANYMFAIKVLAFLESDEELRPIRVGSRVGHAHHTCMRVTSLEVLVAEQSSID